MWKATRGKSEPTCPIATKLISESYLLIASEAPSESEPYLPIASPE